MNAPSFLISATIAMLGDNRRSEQPGYLFCYEAANRACGYSEPINQSGNSIGQTEELMYWEGRNRHCCFHNYDRGARHSI